MSLKTIVKPLSYLTLAALLSATASPALAQPEELRPVAQDMSTTTTINDSAGFVSGRISLGTINGEAKERVYDTPGTGSKISELTWELSNVAMLGAGLSVKPLRWLKFNADIWVKVSDGSGAMDDYDWPAGGSEWNQWSHHNDLTVDTGFILDVNAEMTVFRHNQTSVFGIIGFKHDDWAWTARGGKYIYSVYTFRDTVGTIPEGVAAISYEQWFDTPYIGLGFQTDLTPVTLTGRLIGSTLVTSRDRDQHHLTHTLYEDDFNSGSMLSCDLAGTYHYTERLSFSASFHFQHYYEVKGPTTMTNQTTHAVVLFAGDAASTEHQSALFSLSLLYSF